MYSRKRLRRRGFDYASTGLYLVTVCTYERRCVLSRVKDDAVIMSPSGAIVARQIEHLPSRMTSVFIDRFVVMPNHVHLVVALQDERARQASPLRTRLGHAVAAFKSGSAREINALRGTPGANVWQRGYHDHVIRDEADLRRVREYIASNPIRWSLDPENPSRTS